MSLLSRGKSDLQCSRCRSLCNGQIHRDLDDPDYSELCCMCFMAEYRFGNWHLCDHCPDRLVAAGILDPADEEELPASEPANPFQEGMALPGSARYLLKQAKSDWLDAARSVIDRDKAPLVTLSPATRLKPEDQLSLF